MRSNQNPAKRLTTAAFALLAAVSVLLSPAAKAEAASYKSITTRAVVANTQKYGNVVLDLKCTDLLAGGYAYGDVLNVSFLDRKLALPLCSYYPDVDPGAPGIFAVETETNVNLAINMKDFATSYGIAVKTPMPDGSEVWIPAAGVGESFAVEISMKEPGGYYADYLVHQISYVDDREAYPRLTDEQFANFRPVLTTGMGAGKLYRSASPVDPLHNRNTYADAAIRNAGVNVIMNLVDTEKELKSFEGLERSYYVKQKYIVLNMGVDFEAPDFRQKLAAGLRFFAENPGVYEVHCTEGKDRAGFVSAILECLMGASYDEVIADYMVTFYNYYGITPEDPKYQAILNGNIVKSLQTAFGVKDLKRADLAKEAAEYLRQIGLRDDEIAALKANLGGTEAEDPYLAQLEAAIHAILGAALQQAAN